MSPNDADTPPSDPSPIAGGGPRPSTRTAANSTSVALAWPSLTSRGCVSTAYGMERCLIDVGSRTSLSTHAIFVNHGDVWTSAGIDLALALVADDHGAPAAADVARQLVVYLRRSRGQAQLSALLAAQALDSEPARDLLSWIPDHG